MSQKRENQIDVLNGTVKAKIGVSNIHGVGVFALRTILNGERVYADHTPQVYSLTYKALNGLFPEVKEIILQRWPNIINGSRFAFPDTRLLSFMNHSNEPNYDPKTDTALKKIESGEEITEDYRGMENWEQIFTFISNP